MTKYNTLNVKLSNAQLKPLAKSVLKPLELTAAVSATDSAI